MITKNKRDLLIKHTDIKYVNINKHSLKNKFNCKFIYPSSYSSFINRLSISYNHELSRLFTSNKTRTVRFNSKNYIIVSNHGISKDLSLILSFDCRLDPIKEQTLSFYYIIILDNMNNMINLSLCYSEFIARTWQVCIQNDDIFKKLLKNINLKLSRSEIIKMYFENYKDLLFSFVEEAEKIYKCSLKYYSIQDSYSSYRNMICLSENLDKKQNIIRKPTLDISQRYYGAYPHFLGVSYYIVITEHRLVTNIFIINGLFKGYSYTYYEVFIDLDKIFFIHRGSGILLLDNLQAIMDVYKGNKHINIVDTNYSTILRKIRKVEAEIYTNISQSKKLIELDEKNWLYFYYKQEKEKDSNYNIVYNVITITFVLLKKVKMKIYSQLDEIYREVEYINLHIQEVTKLIDENMKTYERKIYNAFYGFHDNYILKIPVSFCCFLLDENQIKELKAITIDKLTESLPENMLEKENMIYKVIKSFSGPMNVEIDLSNSIINNYYSDNFISQKIMNFSPVIAEVEKEDGVYYLFEIVILGEDIKSSIKINENQNEYRLQISRRIKYNKEKLTDKILIKLYKDKDKHVENYYVNEFEKIIDIENDFRKLVFSFAVKKEVWDQIKCKKGDLQKIKGLFYLYSHFDRLRGSIKIMCTWNEHEVIFK